MTITRGMAMASVLLAGAALASPALAQGSDGLTVTIRAYNAFGVSLADMETASQTLRAVLRDAGVEVRWRDCRMRRGPAATMRDACVDKVGRSELLMRIIGAPRTIPDPAVLGFSYVQPESGEALLGTVFADRTSAVARRLGVERGALLGRAMAHEVGHLLLGSNVHSINSLMRDRWSRRDEREAWLFSVQEAAIMRAAVGVRQDAVGVSMTALDRRSAPP